MGLTTLDAKSAVFIVDLQKGIVGLPVAHPIGDVIGRARAPADALRARDLPVVPVDVAGGAAGRNEQPLRADPFPPGWTDLIPELNRRATDILPTKRRWGAFANPDLEVQLKARDVTQAVIAGVSTGTGVEATARQACEQGFNVTLAIDAMTDTRPEAHDDSIRNVFQRVGETGATQAIIDLLLARSA